MLRRQFIQFLASGVLLALNACTRRVRSPGPYRFRHSVASGDPLSDSVILWTRISGGAGETVPVRWEVATDAGMASLVSSGTVETGPQQDYTVKVDVQGLPAGTPLHYRFIVGDMVSPHGRTRTLAKGKAAAVRFAVVSCSNYPYGFFHAYRDIAQRDDLDAVIHLGDYIYEYGQGQYATEYAEQLGRIPDPRRELLELGDYRRRHAQYKTDPDLQAMHQSHPVIAVWDDHEIVNDSWRDGAQNHEDGEGNWPARVAAALQAYIEWMPIRVEAAGIGTRIFRDFRFGDLVSLSMLDTRLHGRDRQPTVSEDTSADEARRLLDDPGRRMLGDEQSAWLRDSLDRAAGTTWQVIGQQVLVSSIRVPDLESLVDPRGPSSISRRRLEATIRMSKANPPLLLDTWDGYAAARERLLGTVKDRASNPVFLSGDLHTSIAGDLVPDGGEAPVAVEFMTTSVTSPGFAEYLPEYVPGSVAEATLSLNPRVRYMETSRRGWLCMTFTPDECMGEWHLIDDTRSRKYSVEIDRRLRVRTGAIAGGLRDA